MQQEPGVAVSQAFNVNVYGGEVAQCGRPTHGAGINALKEHVSTKAFASHQEGDAPKCHPNTRLAVLNEVMTWILRAAVDRITWLMWIVGAAGAGKSAIARSVVDLCLEQPNVIIARFFFFRADGTRNTLDHVVATIAYQLIQSLPALDSLISATLRSHPLIFEDSLETQLRLLVFEPLQQLHRLSPITKAIVLLFDGVDECDGSSKQIMLIKMLHLFVSAKLVPVTVLFLSRPEVEIKSTFQSRAMAKITRYMELDDKYLPDKDIKQYLHDRFLEIKETHPFRHFLPENWPSDEAVRQIVEKSSGQFIYASVAVNYISASRLNPADQLEVVLGIQPPPGHLKPFAQLDALYHHIFSQVSDLDRVLSILATFILSVAYVRLRDYAKLLDLTVNEVEVALVDLASVVHCKGGIIRIHHASLADFLFNENRSGAFHINPATWSTRLSILYLTRKDRPSARLINGFIKQAEPTAELRQVLLSAHPDLGKPRSYNGFATLYVDYLNALSNVLQSFEDGAEIHQRKRDECLSFFAAYRPRGLDFLSMTSMSNHSVRNFLKNCFTKIRKTHPFAVLLPDNWPGEAAIDEITANSAGQFLYVYVATQEISCPRRHPALQLEVMRTIRAPTGDLSPFAALDGLYRHMLSQVFDLDRTMFILATCVMCDGTLIMDNAQLHDMPIDEIKCSIAELTSVMSCDDNKIDIFRSSFLDFIFDKSRSLQYHVDKAIWANRILMQHLAQTVQPDHWFIGRLLHYADPTPELQRAILSPLHDLRPGGNYDVGKLTYYLHSLRHLNCGDGGKAYQQKLDDFTRWVHSNCRSELKEFDTWNHDIGDILTSIKREAAEKQLSRTKKPSPTSVSNFGHVDDNGSQLEDASDYVHRDINPSTVLPESTAKTALVQTTKPETGSNRSKFTSRLTKLLRR